MKATQQNVTPERALDRHWLYAERAEGEAYPQHSARGGKWMLFIKIAVIDEWWGKVKEATVRGYLGSSAKVATMKENPNAANKDTKVICIYTYDVDDNADCSRVRDALRELGVTWKIPYKLDVDSIAGKYSDGTGVRISKRYE